MKKISTCTSIHKLIRVGLAAAVVIFFGGFLPQYSEVQASEIAQAGDHDENAGHDDGEGGHSDHAGHDHDEGSHADHAGHDHGNGSHEAHGAHGAHGAHEDHEGHDHGDHTGLLEVGAHVAFLRVTHDETAGTIKIEVFGPDAKSPLELEKSPRLNLFVGGKRKQVKTAGEAGVFAATDQGLRGHVHGGIRLTVGGKSYLVPLPDDNH